MPSQTVKRQRQRRRIDQDGDPEFQVAPMVDVLLVLMLFFMAITSTEVLKKDKTLHLPEANHAKPDDKNHDKKKNEIVVNVSWIHDAGVISVDGVTYPAASDLQGMLTTRCRQNPQAYVLIRADQDVQYSNISDIMSTCAAAGIATVSFATITNPAQQAAASPEGK